MACAVSPNRDYGMKHGCTLPSSQATRQNLIFSAAGFHVHTTLQALQKDLALCSAGKLMLLHGQQPTMASMFDSVNKQPMASASIAQVCPDVAFNISIKEWTQVSIRGFHRRLRQRPL